METAYRQIEWHWKEWNGPYDRIEKSKIVDVPYKRRPRIFIEPPSVEISIYHRVKGDVVLVAPVIKYEESSYDRIIHIVNLFLEIFGECEFFKKDLSDIIEAPIRRLNWKILPPGKRPWSQLEKELNPLIKGAPEGIQPVINHRLEFINRHKPVFAAIGEGGFRGYIILGFIDKGFYFLESLYYGNATYIFDDTWEELSKKTKAEILNNKLQSDRIIHREGWDEKVSSWFKA